MKPFDDLSDAELASLNEDEVKQYVRQASMEEGIPLAFELEEIGEEPTVNAKETEYYSVEHDGSNKTGVVFLTREDAEAFTRLKYAVIHSKYLGGYSKTMSFTDRPVGAKVVRVGMLSKDELDRNLLALEEQAQRQKSNSEARRERESREAKIQKVQNKIWSRLSAARSAVRKAQEIKTCLAEYRKLAKDEASAIACLKKAYPDKEDLLNTVLGHGWDILVGISADEVEQIPF